MTPKVLIVVYGGGHATLMAPVIQRLVRAERVTPVVLGLTTASPLLASKGIAHRGYAYYFDQLGGADALELGRSLVRDVNSERVGVSEAESLAYMSLCMRDLVNDKGRDAAFAEYSARGRHAFLPRQTMGQIIEFEKPRLVVTTNSPKSERAAILEANCRGIPTLLVPDMFADPVWETYHPFQAQWYAAISEVAKGNLVRHHGAIEQNVVITGQPKFDKSSVADVARCRELASRALGIDSRLPFVLVATTWDWKFGINPTHTHCVDVVDRLIGQRSLWPDVSFVIKPHPNEPSEDYSSLINGHSNFVLASPNLDLDILLRASRGVLAAGTTTAIVDALSLDVPVASADWTGGSSTLPYVRLAVPRTSVESDLPKVVIELLNNTNPSYLQAEVRKQLTNSNKGAIDNVATLIEHLAMDGTAE